MNWIARTLCITTLALTVGCGGQSDDENAKSLSTFRGETAEHWTRMLSDRDPGHRAEATRALAALADEATGAVDELIVALNDENASVRAGAAQVLGEIGTPAAAAESGLQKLMKDKNAVVRVSAILALGQVTGSPSADLMINALRDENQSVRDQAASLIVKMGPPAIQSLSKLMGDTDVGLRVRAIDIVGKIGHTDGVRPLIHAMDDEERQVRDAAILALGDFGPSAIPMLAELKADASWENRWGATYALMLIATPEAAEPLVAALVDEDERVRTQAIEGLTRMGSDAIPALTQAVKHENDAVRLAVITALSGIGTSETIPILQTAVSDESAQIREVAVLALGATGSKDALPALTIALKNDDPKVRGDATSSLVRIGRDAIPVFESTVIHNNWQVRRSSAVGLGMIGLREAVPGLNKFLYDKDARVRAAAAKAIGQVGPQAAASVSPLVWALDDEEADVRDNAAFALARVGSGVDTVIPALIKALNEGDPRVRISAARAIARLGTNAPSAVQPLITAMRSKDAPVAGAARLALIRLGTEAVDGLAQALAESDSAQRIQVTQVLGQIGSNAARAVPELVKLLLDKDAAVYDATVFSLSLIGTEAKVALVKASRGNDKQLAALANRALQTILKQE